MAAERLVHEANKPFDCTPFHGKYVTMDMTGQDVGFAGVGLISSGEEHLLFQYRGKRGLANKAYITRLTQVNLRPRQLKKETPLVAQPWDEDVNPFCYFVGERCDIHLHQTRLFEATPGFFGALILYVDLPNGLMRIKENGKQFNVSLSRICSIIQK